MINKRTLLLLLNLIWAITISSQVTISGVVKDNETGEMLIGANVVEKGTINGVTVDIDGSFKLKVQELPITLEISYVGYITQDYEVASADEKVKINLKSDQVNLAEVQIVDTRMTDKMKEAPQTIETMDAISIKETSSADFYEGLGHLKGVDVTSASIGFKVVNTRGFNSTNPVRSLQLIDGVDNQSPGLNFSLGNFLGASELDVQRVELVVGANGALFGPNAFNGVINMKTKDPFIHKGLTVLAKVGERNLKETAFRFAHAFQNKEGKDKLAVKLNFYYMEANDWEANNLDSVYGQEYGPSNPGGYDAVNRYGDENETDGINNSTGLSGIVNRPGLGRWYRTGYLEKDIVDYNTDNLKASGAFHYKVTPDVELILTSNYSTGTTVMQGDNRFSLKNIEFFQHRLELKKEDKFFLRSYVTHEDAGDSYDAVATAFLLQDAAKDNITWSKDYTNFWIASINPRIKSHPDWPTWNPFFEETPYEKIDSLLATLTDSLFLYHELAEEYANQAQPLNADDLDRYEPGTPRFDSALAAITSKKAFIDGGSGLYDKSLLYHIHGEYKFEPKVNDNKLGDLILGGNFRTYLPKSNGTIFNEPIIIDSTVTADTVVFDTTFRQIKNREFGAYLGLGRAFLEDEALKVNATLRMDKNQNFDYLFSPAVSAVYVKNEKTYRVSFSSAIRNPTLTDQYLRYNVGRAILLGNVSGIDSLVTTESLSSYFSSEGLERDSLVYFSVDPIRPEKVKSIEIGYRGAIKEKVYIDASYFFSSYKDFIGYKIGVDLEFDTTYTNLLTDAQAYRVAANAESVVTTQGFSLGINYYLTRTLSFIGNYSWNRLNKKGADDPIIPAFNTPEHKFNLGLSGRNVKIGNTKHFGFAINYKWIQGFLFEGSPQFTGLVPSYDAVDAQINYHVPKIKSTFKLGASNIMGVQPFFDSSLGNFSDRSNRAFNNMNLQVYGGPYVGRMLYFSILVEIGEL